MVHKAKTSPGYVNSFFRFQPDFPFFHILLGKRDDSPIEVFHFHNALEIGYCREGAGTFLIGGKVLSFQQGDLTVITPLEWHRSRSAPGTCTKWSWFFSDPARLLVPSTTQELPYDPAACAGEQFRNVLPGAEYPELTAVVREMIYEGGAKAAGWQQSMRGLLLLFLQRLARRLPAPASRAGRTAAIGKTPHGEESSPSRILPALNAIAHRYDEDWRVEELARLCHMSTRNFQIQFRKRMNQSPQIYLIRCRVQAAAALLRATGQSVTQIAFACGFGSLSSFHRSFQSVTGTSPRELRRRSTD